LGAATPEAFLALYSTILCAIDFSEQSRRALRLGLAVAARQGSRMAAVHVIDPLLAEAAASMSGATELRADAESELRALVEAERGAVRGSLPVTSIVRIGPPAREILASARDIMAVLVVMGTQGLGGFRKLFFGSIAEKVLRDAHVPVLAVPSPEPPDSGGAPVIDLVIASVQLDNSADAVVGHAVTFATVFGLPLTLLHVVPPIEGMPRAAAAARAAERLHEASAHARLTELAARVRSGLPLIGPTFGSGVPSVQAPDLKVGPTFRVEVSIEVRCGGAAEEIAAAAASRHALVTIASGGDSHHRPGSIAYRVLCLSDSPVLAIPLKQAVEP
jgi:nucleotide-binding universal stress UspA family protein